MTVTLRCVCALSIGSQLEWEPCRATDHAAKCEGEHGEGFDGWTCCQRLPHIPDQVPMSLFLIWPLPSRLPEGKVVKDGGVLMAWRAGTGICVLGLEFYPGNRLNGPLLFVAVDLLGLDLIYLERRTTGM